MKKFLCLIMLFSMFLLAACGQDDGTTSLDTSSNNRTGSKMSEIDVFKDVKIEYDGWNGCEIDVNVITDDCDNFVKENVKFHVTEIYNQMYNGDIITLVAEYDEKVFANNKYNVISDRQDYEVSGLREILKTTSFRDDVAWVQVKVNSSKAWCCCDKEGNILFVLDANSLPTTCFANGVAVVDGDKIIDKQGNIVWSAKKDGVNFIKNAWGEDSVANIEFYMYPQTESYYYPMSDFHSFIDHITLPEYYGYVVMKAAVDSYEFTADLLGIIDYNGKWVIDPQKDRYDFASDDPVNGKNGIILIDNFFYNMVTNEKYYVDDYYGAIDKETLSFIMKNYFAEHNGLMYMEKSLDSYSNEETRKAGFYNSEFKLKIDLSKYSKIYNNPEFNDGYAILDLANEQGSWYYTVIDTNGNEMFKPRQFENHENIKCGYYWVYSKGYFDVNGQAAFDLPIEDGNDFSNGMAEVKIIDERFGGTDPNYATLHYINIDGEIVF